MILYILAQQTIMSMLCLPKESLVADFFRKLFGTKTTDEPAPQKQVDMATTAPLSDQQINSILTNQSLKYEMKHFAAWGSQLASC
jgi:hypothetical protein